MADDLVELTLQLCGKDQDHAPRFPERFYDSYVTRIVDTALDIQEAVSLANDDRENSLPERRMNARLNKIGYQLRIVKHAGGKVHWRVVVEPLGGKTCQEQSQI